MIEASVSDDHFRLLVGDVVWWHDNLKQEEVKEIYKEEKNDVNLMKHKKDIEMILCPGIQNEKEKSQTHLEEAKREPGHREIGQS